MDEDLYYSFYKITMKMIENSNFIEKFYKDLANIELKNEKKSEEYKKLSSFITDISIKEKKIINDVLNSHYSIFFKDFIFDKKCNRLIDKINNEYEFTRALITKNAEYKYKKDENAIKNYISKDAFIKLDYDELGKHIVRHNIFNTIQSKMYIKVLDNYISNIENESLKKRILEEKYGVINRNSTLENWYFDLCLDNDWLLIDSDKIVALELGLVSDDYIKLKNEYFEKVIENCIDIMLEGNVKTNDDKIMLEMNILSALLCMDPCYLSDIYYDIEEDIKSNPELYNKDSIEFIEDAFSNSQIVEKKLRMKYPYEEV